MHPPDAHPHYTKCCPRCDACKAKAAAYARRYRRLHAYGTWAHAWQPPDPVRDHLQALVAAGTTLKEVVRITGLAEPTIYQHHRGNRTRVSPRVTRIILAVQPQPRYVPTIGAQRRGRALARLGYPLVVQAQMLDIPTRTYREVVGEGRHRRWSRVRAQAQAALYDRLAFDLPPVGWLADRTRADADRRGWASPAAWDDDTIDDPKAKPAGTTTHHGRPSRSRDPQPDLEAIDEVLAGRRRWSDLNDADRTRLVTRLLDNGWPPSRIAHRLGLSGTTVTAIVDRIRPAPDEPRGAIAA